MRDYIRLFPSSPLAALFNGYFAYKGENIWTEDIDETPSLIEDPLDVVLVGFISDNMDPHLILMEKYRTHIVIYPIRSWVTEFQRKYICRKRTMRM